MRPEHSRDRPRSGKPEGSCFTPAAPGQGEAAAPRLCHGGPRRAGKQGGLQGSSLPHPSDSGHLEGGHELSPRPQGSVDAGAGLKVNVAPQAPATPVSLPFTRPPPPSAGLNFPIQLPLSRRENKHTRDKARIGRVQGAKSPQ